jgi:hypothetical protein
MISMQDGFLFDDRDSKQRGYGVDALHQDDDGLKAHWQWTRGRGAGMSKTNRRCVGQVSEAEVGDKILLRVIFWHRYYEIEMYWVDACIESYCVDPSDGSKEKALLTRVDAQRKAERMTRAFVKDFSQELILLEGRTLDA